MKIMLNSNLSSIPLDYLVKSCNRNNQRELNIKAFVSTDIPATSFFHKNYLEYLEYCYGYHLGAVITPDIIWYSILCEIAEIVKESPETYRSLFTDSDDKKEITVFTDDETKIPLDKVISQLRLLVPTNTDAFLPNFSTSNDRTTFAFNAAFCDAVSPFYSYSTFCCGIPTIDIRGDVADYKKLESCWNELAPLFEQQSMYVGRVAETLNKLSNNLYNPKFWNKIFASERCGSGSETEVFGWWTSLYRKQPESVRKSCNFSSHISIIDYKNISSGNKYQMKVGLLSSVLQDGTLEPDFNQIIYRENGQ